MGSGVVGWLGQVWWVVGELGPTGGGWLRQGVVGGEVVGARCGG